MKSYGSWVLCLYLLCVPLSSYGFEFYEHRNLGNLAIRIAFDYYQDSAAFVHMEDAKRQQWMRARDELLSYRNMDNRPDIMYGDLVKGVDDMRYPKLVFSRFNEKYDYLISGYPESEKQLNRVIVPLFFRQTSQDMYKASSNNFQHFQGELFETMKSLHHEAVALAGYGNLFSALAMNALSDHFLHDFFAPGHITTNRENSHDGVALAMHDWSNEHGADFFINQQAWPDLEILLRFLIDHCENYYLFHDENGKPLNMNCSASDGVDDSSINQRQVMQDLLRSHTKIRMHGDGLLYQNSAQVVFMLLVEVRSILDVMVTFNNDPANRQDVIRVPGNEAGRVNHFVAYNWSGTYDYFQRRPMVPAAGFSYGKYQFEEDQIGKAYDIIIYTIAGQAPIKDGSSSGEISIEWVPLSLMAKSKTLKDAIMQQPSDICRYMSMCNLGVALGAVAYRNDELSAEGMQLRFIKVRPKISTLYSIYVRSLRYHDDVNVDEWNWSYGARFDTGFSIYSAFVGLERGYGYDQPASRLDRGVSVTFGVGVGLPLSRHWFW